jgi:hypothetical protein
MATELGDSAKQVTDRDLLSFIHQVRRGRTASPASPGDRTRPRAVAAR